MKTYQNITLFLALSFLLSVVGTNAQTVSTDKNTVIHYKARSATTDPNAINGSSNSAVTISYSDGLSRSLQTLGYGTSPTQKDIVLQAVEYDGVGRQITTFLPAPATQNTGAYQNNVGSLAASFYQDASPKNTVRSFDNSPLNRSVTTYGAGQAWVGSSRYQEVLLGSNTPTDGVRLYRTAASGAGASQFYVPGTLYKKTVYDEHRHKQVEFTDNEGNVVERWVMDGVNGADTTFTKTAYIYNDIGRISYILSPKGYEADISFSENSSEFSDFIFAYRYDERERVTEKHIPSGGWSAMVYDFLDRPVLEQTALQAQNSKWSFTKYDVFGRVIITGELTNPNSRATLQTLFDGVATPYETWNGSTYTAQSYPISYNATDEKAWQFYDQYNWITSDWAFNSSTAYNASSYYANAVGLPTGGWNRDPENPSIVYHSVLHYDNKGRIIQTYQVHQKGGAARWQKPIRTDYEYNFAGEITKEKVSYKIDGFADTQTLTTNEYDHVGRLLKVFHSINGAANQELCRYSYDEIGRLKEKIILPNGNFLYGGAKDYILRPTTDGAVSQPNTQDIARKAVILEPINSIDALTLTSYLAQIDPTAPQGQPITGLQKINYSYHIRGGLRGINLDASGNVTPNTSEADLFAYKLDYETTNQWDGNIGKQYWKNTYGQLRTYSFDYDPSKRLKNATYAGTSVENFAVQNLAYDKNGNITALQRFGSIGTNSYGLVDNLTYTYNGNRLQQITDTQSSDNGAEFVQRGNASYTFYADGSLKSDANEQIQNIVYDTFLKQPTEVLLTDGRKIKNYYDGGGTLLKIVYFDAQNTVLETWEYVGQLVYKNGVPYQLTTPEGRAVFNEGTWTYEFNYTDHLDNTRVSFKADGSQLVKTAETAFDPWGVRLNGVGSVNGFQNRYEFLDREKESTFGLNYYRLGARGYNPTNGRFDRVEPLTQGQENWSVYQYGYNNPIRYSDPDGLEPLTGQAAQDAFKEHLASRKSKNEGCPPNCESSKNGGGDPKTAYDPSSSTGHMGQTYLSQGGSSLRNEIDAWAVLGVDIASMVEAPYALWKGGASLFKMAKSWFTKEETIKFFSGIQKAWAEGATPNSVYTRINPKTGKALQNNIYNSEGKIIGQVDFDIHGAATSGHGHIMTTPGDFSSGHTGTHIPYESLPNFWKKLPKGVTPQKPIINK